MASLYIVEEGAKINLNSNRLIIKFGDEVLKEVGIEKVDSVVLLGWVHVTTPVMTELLRREIPLTYLSATGKFFGRLEPTAAINIERRREQFRRGDDAEFCLSLAKRMLAAKIRNQRVLLRRYNEQRNIERVEKIRAEMKRCEDGLDSCVEIEQIMGHEGQASRCYFEALSLLTPSYYAFKGRSKQPPKDPFNSLLSLGYTLLLYEIYTACVNKGLDPYASFVHSIRRGHPALCSDLIEEWRPVLVDAMVMNMVSRNIISLNDFQDPDDKGGIYMHKPAIKKFIGSFEERLRSENKYLDYIDYPLSFRESLQFQVGSLAKAIEAKDATIYRPVTIR